MTAITLLDGSIGQELVKRSSTAPTHLWSTSVMMDQPHLVGDVHRAYFDAGSTIATTNTYPVHRSRLEREGMEDKLADLVATAMQQAHRARDAHGSGRIAGALGPLIASFRPDLKPDPVDAAIKFKELADLMEDHVDLYLIESASSVLEAEGALAGLSHCSKPVWVSFTVNDENGTLLRSGEPLSDAAPLIRKYAPEAVLINCSRPESFPAALGIIREFGLPFGGYANGFTHISSDFLKTAPTVAALDERTDLPPSAYADHVMHWIEMGATIVGGCCEIGPDHIVELARRIRAAGHSIV